LLDREAKKTQLGHRLGQRKFAVKDRFMPDLAFFYPYFLLYFQRTDLFRYIARSVTACHKFQNTCLFSGHIVLLVIRATSVYEQSDGRIMSNCFSSHPLLNPLTLNFNTQIEMMAVDDIGVGAHLVLTASEQATDSAVI
jgi:hypothetical protein